MLDFERRKEKNIFNSLLQREESVITTEQSKSLYDISIKNENKIKKLEKDMSIIKPQIYDILNMLNLNNESLRLNNNIYKDNSNNNFTILRNELLDYINQEIKKQLKENIPFINNQLVYNNNDNKDLFFFDNNNNNLNRELPEHDSSLTTIELNKTNNINNNKEYIDRNY